MHNLVNFKASEATMVPRALSHGLFQKPTVQKIVLAWCNGQEQLCKSQSTMQIGAKLLYPVHVGGHTELGFQRLQC